MIGWRMDFFYMTLGQGARVQFDDIHIIQLP